MTHPRIEEDKIHFFKLKDKKIRYICNEACKVTEGKYTNDFFKITCNNCKGMLIRNEFKYNYNKGFKEGLIAQIDEELEFLKVLLEEKIIEEIYIGNFIKNKIEHLNKKKQELTK